MRRSLCIVTALLMGPAVSQAATYVVDGANGNDGAAGSAAAPWKTIGRGVDGAEAGDTILVKAKASGPVCHTGNKTCFFQRLAPSEVEEDHQQEA